MSGGGGFYSPNGLKWHKKGYFYARVANLKNGIFALFVGARFTQRLKLKVRNARKVTGKSKGPTLKASPFLRFLDHPLRCAWQI